MGGEDDCVCGWSVDRWEKMTIQYKGVLNR